MPSRHNGLFMIQFLSSVNFEGVANYAEGVR